MSTSASTSVATATPASRCCESPPALSDHDREPRRDREQHQRVAEEQQCVDREPADHREGQTVARIDRLEGRHDEDLRPGGREQEEQEGDDADGRVDLDDGAGGHGGARW